MRKRYKSLIRKDFLKISRSGLYVNGPILLAQCDSSEFDCYRVGFTASKKVGNAVVRNRCKRRMRAAAAIVLSEFGLHYVDYVLIARKSLYNVNWNVLLELMRSVILSLNTKVSKRLAINA